MTLVIVSLLKILIFGIYIYNNYSVWDGKEFNIISDLYFGNNLVKTFEDLVVNLTFDNDRN